MVEYLFIAFAEECFLFIVGVSHSSILWAAAAADIQMPAHHALVGDLALSFCKLTLERACREFFDRRFHDVAEVSLLFDIEIAAIHPSVMFDNNVIGTSRAEGTLSLTMTKAV